MHKLKTSFKTLVTTGAMATMLTATGCASTAGTAEQKNAVYNNMARNAMLGAATGAATQVNGNSENVKDAATVGALLGILGSIR